MKQDCFPVTGGDIGIKLGASGITEFPAPM